MFDVDNFVADCKSAMAQDGAHKAVAELVERAVSDPASVLAGLGEPQRAGVNKIYADDSLTILNLVWGPRMV